MVPYRCHAESSDRGEVVGNEGIEFTTSLPFYVQISNISDSLLDTDYPAIVSNHFSQSYLSQKIFVYVDAKNRSRAIESHRIHPIHSPSRPVQSVKELHQIVTMGINKDGFLRSEVGRLLPLV